MKHSILTTTSIALLLAAGGCATAPISGPHCSAENACAAESCCNCQGQGNGHCGNKNCQNKNCKRADDFSPFAVPVKPGHYVNGWTDAMRCSAAAEQFVIARNAWFNGGPELGPEASDNMIQLAAKLNAGDDHVLLEKEPVQPEYSETLAAATARTNQLDSQRRESVIAALQSAGVANADSRVHLSPIDELGSRGIGAPQVFNSLFSNGNRGGRQNGGGGQSQGGLGGGGGGRQGF